MVGAVLIAAGLACIAIAAIDAFLTMVGVHRGGPLTNRWTRLVWRGLLAIHRRRPMHPTLALTGPAMMVVAILLWYTLLGLGWFLVFAGGLWMGGVRSVIDNQTGREVGALDHLYFVVSSLSTTGYGDLVAAGFPWTILANASAFTATFLVTLSLSYVMPLVQAALQKQIIASRVFSIGATPGEIVANSWTRGNAGMLDAYWLDVFGRLSTHAQQHSVYPMLHYFHSAEARNASSRAILVLADAIYLLELVRPDARPPPAFFTVAHRALHEYARLAGPGEPPTNAAHGAPAPPERHDAEHLGLPPAEEHAAAAAWDRYQPTRRALIALCRQDGWC